MTVNQLKKKLHNAIDENENEALLKAINLLLKSESRHAELVIPGKPMTEETLRGLVQESEADYKAGYFYTHDEVLELAKQWKKKKPTK